MHRASRDPLLQLIMSDFCGNPLLFHWQNDRRVVRKTERNFVEFQLLSIKLKTEMMSINTKSSRQCITVAAADVE